MDHGTSARILIVDDIPESLAILVNWLQTQNYAVLQATSGAEALTQAAKHQPDLILMDVMMPDMDGIETCRRLKDRPQTATIPVILVTAKDPSDARADGMIAGAVDYITKPVNLKNLTTRIQYVLAAQHTTTPVDVQRLMEEVAHGAMAILDSLMVWLLTATDQLLEHQLLTTNSSPRDEENFLFTAASGENKPIYSQKNTRHIFIEALLTRQIITNLPLSRADEALQQAGPQLNISYITIVPLMAAGKTEGIMVLGYTQPQEIDTPRAHQILSALGSQAATAISYSRLITNLQQREQEAQREHAFRQMILDTMSDGLVVMDALGNIKFTNRRLLRMTGYPEGQLEGHSIGLLFHPDDRDEVMYGLLSEKASTMKFDQRLITRTGQVLPVLISRSRNLSNELDNQVIVLSDVTQQKQREHALERQAGHLMALNQAAHIMTSNLSLYEVLNDILNSAISVVEGQGASLFLVNGDQKTELRVVAAVGHRAEEFIGLKVPIGEGLAGWVAREAQSQLVIEPATDPRFYSRVDEQTGMQTHSLIAVPLQHSHEVIGVIEVVNKLNGGVFDAEDVRLLESIAGTAAVSIINARLYDETQRQVAELSTLLSVSEAVSSTLDLAQTLRHVLRNLTDSLAVSRAFILNWPDESKSVNVLAHTVNAFWPDLSGPLENLQTNTTHQIALLTNQPVAGNLSQDDLSAADRNNLTARGMTGLLAVPISQANQVCGIITLYRNDSNNYGDEVPLLTEIITQWQVSLSAETPFARTPASAHQQVSKKLLETPPCVWVSIHAWSPGNSSIRLLHESGFSEWTQPENTLQVALDQFSLTRQTIQQQETIQLQLNADDTHHSGESEWLRKHGEQSILFVPLLLHGASIGLLALTDTHDRIFRPEEIRIAQGTANVMAKALENARLYLSLQSRARALEAAYAELQEADQIKDELIQNVSHELRTPLIHIIGYADLMTDQAFGDITQEQKDALTSIIDKSQQIAGILSDMTAIQSQQQADYQLTETDVRDVIQHVLNTMQNIIQRSGLRILTQLPPQLPTVLADHEAISSAFSKLLDNALKFGQEGERIEIMVRDTPGPTIQIGIRDHGIGIPQEEHTRIFQRFYQVDGSATRRFGGTGLGLAVAKTIIEAHGGKIGLSSTPGEGSIFYFSLPKYDIKRKQASHQTQG